MTPERVFQILTGIGLITGGWLYGEYWKNSRLELGDGEEASVLRAENSELTTRIDELEDDLAKVRAMLADGPYPIPKDMISWVETDYNMVYLSAPEVRLAPPQEIQATAEANLKFVHGEDGLTGENLAWELLGLLPPDQRLMGQLVMVNSAGAKGIFDLTSEKILISENFDSVSVPDRSVLVRLLGQLLSFQNHPQKSWETRDEWQAWQSVHVGSSGASASRFLRRNAAANEAEFQDPELAREELLNDLAPALQGFSNFPYLDGANYSRFFYLDSREAFARMFREPARTTATILHPNRRNVQYHTVEFPDQTGTLLTSNQIGELGLRLWLEPYAGILEAGPLAEEWRGDRYEVRDYNGQIHLVWRIALSSEKAAASLAAEVERSMLVGLGEIQPKRKLEISSEGTLFTFRNSPRE